jgi:hypothetical protein
LQTVSTQSWVAILKSVSFELALARLFLEVPKAGGVGTLMLGGTNKAPLTEDLSATTTSILHH